MQSHLRVERRAYARQEQQTAEEKAANEKHEQQRLDEIHDEAAVVEADANEVLDHIDAELARNRIVVAAGYLSIAS